MKWRRLNAACVRPLSFVLRHVIAQHRQRHRQRQQPADPARDHGPAQRHGGGRQPAPAPGAAIARQRQDRRRAAGQRQRIRHGHQAGAQRIAAERHRQPGHPGRQPAAGSIRQQLAAEQEGAAPQRPRSRRCLPPGRPRCPRRTAAAPAPPAAGSPPASSRSAAARRAAARATARAHSGSRRRHPAHTAHRTARPAAPPAPPPAPRPRSAAQRGHPAWIAAIGLAARAATNEAPAVHWRHSFVAR